MNYEEYMNLALEQAKIAYKNGDVPIGCVIVYNDKVIGKGCNMRVKNGNSLHHAEIIAIDQACKYMKDWRLEDCTLFVTVEPCPMCAGAIVQSRIPAVVFGTRNNKAGCAGSVMNILQNDDFNHRVEVTEGVLQEECSNIMKDFFRDFRSHEKKGVIFDFDGTLADSCGVWRKVDEDFFSKRGMDIPEDYDEKICTMNLYQGAVFTKEQYGIKETIEEIIQEWQESAVEQYRENVRLKDHAADYIKILHRRGVKIGLATANTPEFYMPVLEKYDVAKYFTAFADGSDDLPTKDSPEIYMLCAQRLGVSPENCTVYEDIVQGANSALKAGMQVVGVYDDRIKDNRAKMEEICCKYIMDFSEEIGIMNSNNKKY